MNCPGQGPASRAPALKVSSYLCGASEGNNAQAGHRMPAALWVRESDFQEPKPSGAVTQLGVHVSRSAPEVSPSHSQGTDGDQQLGPDPPLVPISTREALEQHLLKLTQHRRKSRTNRLQQREAETEGEIPFPQYTRDDVLMEFTAPTHLQRTTRKLNEVCTPNSSPRWDVQLP